MYHVRDISRSYTTARSHARSYSNLANDKCVSLNFVCLFVRLFVPFSHTKEEVNRKHLNASQLFICIDVQVHNMEMDLNFKIYSTTNDFLMLITAFLYRIVQFNNEKRNENETSNGCEIESSISLTFCCTNSKRNHSLSNSLCNSRIHFEIDATVYSVIYRSMIDNRKALIKPECNPVYYFQRSKSSCLVRKRMCSQSN